ncbi:MAG: LysM peptidoglycan-binding domain-containing protein, partial [Bacteroidota bacterium]
MIQGRRFGFVRILPFLVVILFCFDSQESAAQQLESADTAKVRFLNNRKFYIYKVSKGETLYGISRKFGIPVDEITELNSETVRNGLKPKTELWIPAYSWKKKDGTVVNLKDTIGEPAFEGDRRLHIVVFSPMNLDKVYARTGYVSDTTDTYDPIDKDIQESVEFVQGILYGAETFISTNDDIAVKITVIDTQQDTARLSKVLWRYRTTSDVWITNESGSVLNYISRNAKRSGIQLLSCGVNTTQFIRKNEHAISMLPSSLTQCEMIGKYMAEKYEKGNGVFLKTSGPKEIDRYKAFLKGWTDASQNPARTVD